jgi:hypothetical protein
LHMAVRLIIAALSHCFASTHLRDGVTFHMQAQRGVAMPCAASARVFIDGGACEMQRTWRCSAAAAIPVGGGGGGGMGTVGDSSLLALASASEDAVAVESL